MDDTELEHGSAQLQQYLVAPGDNGEETLFFYGAGEEWSLPIEARPFIVALSEHPRFRLGDSYGWDPLLQAEDVRAIVTQLLEVDLLRRCAG